MSAINFYLEDINYNLKCKKFIRKCIYNVIINENKYIENINVILTSDEYLNKINVKYLNHDTYTDTITFSYNDEKSKEVFGDIYVSIDRIRENAKKYRTTLNNELLRIIIHGCLHLCGYEDKGTEEGDKKTFMILKQEKYLKSFN